MNIPSAFTVRPITGGQPILARSTWELRAKTGARCRTSGGGFQRRQSYDLGEHMPRPAVQLP
jgi:hypothetical protein